MMPSARRCGRRSSSYAQARRERQEIQKVREQIVAELQEAAARHGGRRADRPDGELRADQRKENLRR